MFSAVFVYISFELLLGVLRGAWGGEGAPLVRYPKGHFTEGMFETC